MKRYKARAGNGFARYGIRGHLVKTNKSFRGGERL